MIRKTYWGLLSPLAIPRRSWLPFANRTARRLGADKRGREAEFL